MKKLQFFGMLMFCLINSNELFSQKIRVEGFAGTEAPRIDVFWIAPFAKKSSFLFLSRNTFSIPDYENKRGNFNTLNIAAYQIKNTGLGLALAATATSTAPLQARSGLQFLKVKPSKWLLYSIASSKLGAEADARWLTITQYTPQITAIIDLFLRAEWVTSFGFNNTHRFSASVVRIGLQINRWQFGPGADFLWTGKHFIKQADNYGLFLTHLF